MTLGGSANPLMISRALLSQLLSQSEVPLDVPLEELVIPDSGNTTDDTSSVSSVEDIPTTNYRGRRPQNFDYHSDKKWSPFDDPSMLKTQRSVEGSRKQRRWAHLYEIMKNADITEEDLQLFVKKDSAFSILMKNPQLLNWWYNFVRAPENAQAAYLRKVDQKLNHPKKPTQNPNAPLTADICYQRIDRSTRKSLKKSHIPIGLVAHLENSIIQYLMSENEYDFCDLSVQQESDDEFDLCQTKSNENSHLILEANDPFARLMGHALCQYYGLSAKSEGENEKRVIKARRGKKGGYTPPPVRFSTLLSKQC